MFKMGASRVSAPTRGGPSWASSQTVRSSDWLHTTAELGATAAAADAVHACHWDWLRGAVGPPIAVPAETLRETLHDPAATDVEKVSAAHQLALQGHHKVKFTGMTQNLQIDPAV
jgi:hypothetical protein